MSEAPQFGDDDTIEQMLNYLHDVMPVADVAILTAAAAPRPSDEEPMLFGELLQTLGITSTKSAEVINALIAVEPNKGMLAGKSPVEQAKLIRLAANAVDMIFNS